MRFHDRIWEDGVKYLSIGDHDVEKRLEDINDFLDDAQDDLKDLDDEEARKGFIKSSEILEKAGKLIFSNPDRIHKIKEMSKD